MNQSNQHSNEDKIVITMNIGISQWSKPGDIELPKENQLYQIQLEVDHYHSNIFIYEEMVYSLSCHIINPSFETEENSRNWDKEWFMSISKYMKKKVPSKIEAIFNFYHPSKYRYD